MDTELVPPTKSVIAEHIIARRQQNPGMESIKLDGMNMLEEADWLSKGLRYDFLWFIYLREVAGIYLTPDQQGEVSFFCPPELRGPAWDRYEKEFLEWRDNVFFAPEGYVDAKWFNNAKGILLVTLTLGLDAYGIGIDAMERNNGPIHRVGFKRGETVLQVLDWLADQLEVMDEYVRNGWTPMMIQLPVVITPQGERVAYMPDEPGVRAFFNPLDLSLRK